MKLVFIFGDAATGKMTVGQELAKRTQLKLFHNHITIEPVLEVFGYYDVRVINRLRDVFFEEFAQTDLEGMIFTMMFDFDRPLEKLYIQRIVDIFEEYNENVDVYIVELNAELSTRLERNKTENRLANKPSKRDIQDSERRLLADSEDGRFISYNNEVINMFPKAKYLRIVNDTISPEKQSEMIVNTFQDL